MNSSELKGFLTGLILGDGHIDSGVTKRGFGIKSINEDFINMIYDELKSCTNFDVIIAHHGACYRSGCFHKEYWELRVLAHPYFVKKYHHFYDDNRHRIVSGWALNWLTPRGLANWYMSDGYVCHVGKGKGRVYNRRVEFCTDRYKKQDVEKLAKMLSDKFDLNTSIIKRNSRYRIRILCSSYEHFQDLVEPYIVDSMLYKLYLGYVYQPKWMSDHMWEYQEWLRSAIVLPGNAGEYDIV